MISDSRVQSESHFQWVWDVPAVIFMLVIVIARDLSGQTLIDRPDLTAKRCLSGTMLEQFGI
jgi:hypothetical protein